MKYGFIGFGNLAKAIYQGLKGDQNIYFAFFDINNQQIDSIKSFNSLEELSSFADVVWVCVKPQNLVEVLEEIKNYDLTGKVIVSPVAGKSINFFENYFGNDKTIVRIMPNLAMAYEKSVTAFCANHENENTILVKNNLAKLGQVVSITEEQFDLFTAIFGSGPAFILKTLEVFKERAVLLGIDEKRTNELLLELIYGTTAYLENNQDKSIDELVQNIASRGGVTEAGLNSFKENNIAKLLDEVLENAQNKSKEMGR